MNDFTKRAAAEKRGEFYASKTQSSPFPNCPLAAILLSPSGDPVAGFFEITAYATDGTDTSVVHAVRSYAAIGSAASLSGAGTGNPWRANADTNSLNLHLDITPVLSVSGGALILSCNASISGGTPPVTLTYEIVVHSTSGHAVSEV